ncbi:MAG: two-component system response regulator BaeR [Burkholderiales bacterium PBB3]|nr:MAG: two-component system response regulator BaeR [Burkholderiales bacterium PBB3]
MTNTTVKPTHILVVEDDAAIADMLTNYLHMHGYTTTVCANGLDAVTLARQLQPALLVLDLMLPGQDGIAVCTQVRAFSAVPIIMVTARVDEIDRLLGLETGADDYVCKPFSPREVVARIKALLRRAQGALAVAAGAVASTAPAPSLEIHEDSQTALWQGHALPLTAVEFRLLRLLVSRPQRVFARAELLDHLHDDLRDVNDRTVDSHIKNIRRKLDAAQVVEHAIVSVYGVGYRYERGD